MSSKYDLDVHQCMNNGIMIKPPAHIIIIAMAG